MIAFPALANADLIVDYAATATANTNGQGLSGGAVPFSTSLARSPVLGTNSYGGTSATFYGGVSETGGGAINQFLFDTSDSSFRFRHNASAAGDTAAGIYLWKKDDFLNGLDSVTNVMLTSLDSLSVNSRRFGSNFTDSEIRFVIQEGSTFYISDDTGQIPLVYGTSSISDPTAANWFAYDPSVSISSIGASAMPTFQKLESIGVWFHLTAGASGNRTIAFDNFMANATAVVPEPSALVLLCLGVVVLLNRRMASSRQM